MVAGLTGCSSTNSSAPASNDGPAQVATQYVTAYSKNEPKTACRYVDPAVRATCASHAGLGTYSGQNIKIGKPVISGDRALVAITGTLYLNGSSLSITDPQSGMPNKTISFDQAWKQAVSSSSSLVLSNRAASAMKRVSGKWYIVSTNISS